MSIRRQIFRSYIVLILLLLAFLFVTKQLESFRAEIEDDRYSVVKLRSDWIEMRAILNGTLLDWDGGVAFQQFVDKSQSLEHNLKNLSIHHTSFTKSGKEIGFYIENLYSVWQMTGVIINRITQLRYSSDFRLAETTLLSRPGSPGIIQVYTDSIESEPENYHLIVPALEKYIQDVEFFPLYSDSVEYVFNVIVSKMDSRYDRVSLIYNILEISSILLFILGFVFTSVHFTDSISNPINRLHDKLRRFIGQSIDKDYQDSGDEVKALDVCVADLIDHYTHLSSLASLLATGQTDSQLLKLPTLGVVGNSLREVALYLKELTQAANWIREGKYGSVIEEKSENDILARSFNIMSLEIKNRIDTLQSMFETIDEAMILVDESGFIHEANKNFFRLIECGSLSELDNSLGRIMEKNPSLINEILSSSPLKDHYCEVNTLGGEPVNIKLNVHALESTIEESRRLLIILSNEPENERMKREQKILETQAIEAELMALRAQINPHFLFNALNTLAHLIEADSTRAVIFVEHLADLFRYTLVSTKLRYIPLFEEIDHLTRFIEIEKIRHGSRLVIDIDIDDKIKDTLIPPMILQPLLENAIKYGEDEDSKIRIQLRAVQDGNDLLLEMSDRGKLDVDMDMLLKTDRTGLKNVNQRLQTNFKQGLIFEKNEGEGLKISLKIPLGEIK